MVAAMVLSVVAILISAVAIGYNYYLSVTRPKRIPRPDVEITAATRERIVKQSDEPRREYETWINARNVGSYPAHDLSIDIRLPEGATILKLDPGYFRVQRGGVGENFATVLCPRYEPGLITPPVYVVTSEQPDISYSYHEEKGTVPQPEPVARKHELPDKICKRLVAFVTIALSMNRRPV